MPMPGKQLRIEVTEDGKIKTTKEVVEEVVQQEEAPKTVKERIMARIDTEIELATKRYHKQKIRKFSDTKEMLAVFDEKGLLKELYASRVREIPNQSYASAELSEAYKILFDIFEEEIRKG